MKKRIFSILLCLCMVLMLCPVTALAANEDATKLQELLNTSDTVTLAKDYSIDTTLQVGDHVILDLNGHVIKMTGRDSVIKVSAAGELTLTDSRPNVEHTGEYAGLPAGGVITSDKRAASGGGVYVAKNGSFTMSGGTITGCSATGIGGGGGVYVGGGSFTMIGGAISDCSSNDGGGGVFVGGGSFTMIGGTISDCFAINGGDAIAAINNSTINANGGTIYSEVESFGQILNTSTSGCTKFYGEVKNLSTIDGSGTISGGIFEREVINRSGADITGGTFRNRVQNNGNISGGIYYGKVENYGTISGGMFYGNISGSGISGKTVTFVNDRSRYALEVVADGKTVVAPIEPEAPEGMTFAGWYTDEGLTNKYEFGNTIFNDLTLYAGFEPAVLAITVNGFQVGKTPNDCTVTIESTIPGVIFSEDNIQYSYWDKYAADGDRNQIANNDVFQAGTRYKYFIDLDINGLTEVPVVTVNGNTPDYRTFQYSSGVPEKLSIGCDLGTPALPPITLTVPFTTTVKLGGNTAPGKTTFELAVVGVNADEEAYKNVTVSASVTTNGAGSYEGTMTFKGTFQQLQNMLGSGAFVQQVNAGAPNWTYDDTVWGLLPSTVAMTLTDDAAPEYTVLIYPTYIKDDGSFALDLNAYRVDRMSFTNTYTYSYSAPVRDNVTIIIGGEKEESKPVEENPNTGAPVAASLSTISVLVLASAVAVLKTRKR